MTELRHLPTKRGTKNVGTSFALADYERVKAACEKMGGVSVGGLVKAIVLDWLDEYEREKKEEK